MRMLATILTLISIHASLFSQGELTGTWYFSYGFGTKTISFLPNHQFTFTHSHCTGEESGYGTYFVQRNMLSMHFDSQPDTSGPLLDITSSAASGQLITIRLYLYQKTDDIPVYYEYVELNSKDKGILDRSFTDDSGYVMLQTMRSADTIYVRIPRLLSGDHSSIPLVADREYEITAYLPPYNFSTIIPKGETITFTIEKKTELILSLTTGSGTTEEFSPR